MPFRNYSLTKNGQLTIGQIFSIDYDPGSLGWAIFKNGAAEFNNVTVRGLIQASEFQGTNWLENAAGQFMYSGPPANGNMLLSVAPSNGTDQWGNAYQAGFWAYFGGQAVGLFNQGSDPAIIFAPNGTNITLNPQIFSFGVNAGAANELLFHVLSSGKVNGMDDAAIQMISEAGDGSFAAEFIFEFGGATALTLTKTAGLIADTWHNITLDSGWTSVVAPQYRVLPSGDIQVRGQATHSGFTTSVNVNNSNPIPSADSLGRSLRPSATRVYRGAAQGDAAAPVAMGTGGVLQARVPGFTATQVFLDGMYSI